MAMKGCEFSRPLSHSMSVLLSSSNAFGRVIVGDEATAATTAADDRCQFQGAHRNGQRALAMLRAEHYDRHPCSLPSALQKTRRELRRHQKKLRAPPCLDWNALAPLFRS